jgi:ribonuclease P protein subunit POP4
MNVKIRDLPRHDIIGLYVKIIDSKNKELVGLEGKVINETMNTLEIERDKKVRKIIKSQAIFEIKLGSHTYHIDGRLLVGRPEDRIKKIRSLLK